MHATRARVASNGSSYVFVRVHMRESVCVRVYVCVFARRVSERERACISSEESKKEKRREGKGARRKERKDEGEFVRVSETRRVFIRRDGEWRRGEGEGEINVFVLRPPSYAPG